MRSQPLAPGLPRIYILATRRRFESLAMSAFFTVIALVLMIAVAIVLLLGLRNMMKGGPGNTSQKLMRARVMLQAIAVAVIVAVLYFSR